MEEQTNGQMNTNLLFKGKKEQKNEKIKERKNEREKERQDSKGR
jgi:hypothetical protein